MAFNYGLEKWKFNKQWEILRAEYEAAGLEVWKIQELFDYDWAYFKSRRCNEAKWQEIPSDSFDEEKPHTMFQKFSNLSCELDMSYTSRFFWIEEVENKQLAKVLASLSDKDKELLTLWAIEGFSQTDIKHYV